MVMREDVSNGERVDAWRLEYEGETLLRGSSIGIKRIRTLRRPVEAGKLRLVTKSETAVAPKMKEVRFYYVDEQLLRSVASDGEMQNDTDTAEWMNSAR